MLTPWCCSHHCWRVSFTSPEPTTYPHTFVGISFILNESRAPYVFVFLGQVEITNCLSRWVFVGKHRHIDNRCNPYCSIYWGNITIQKSRFTHFSDEESTKKVERKGTYCGYPDGCCHRKCMSISFHMWLKYETKLRVATSVPSRQIMPIARLFCVGKLTPKTDFPGFVGDIRCPTSTKLWHFLHM